MTYFTTRQSGFSLVETLVAITVLLIVIVGPMTIVTSSSRSTSYASEQVVAFFLAQEGAEFAQKIRDDLLIEAFRGTEPNPWDEFTDTNGDWEECYENAGCGLAPTNDADGAIASPVSCSPIGNCRLFYDHGDAAERVRFSHSNSGSASTTEYTRIIKFDEVSPGQVSVVSEVRWRSGNFRDQQSVAVETFIFDIYGL